MREISGALDWMDGQGYPMVNGRGTGLIEDRPKIPSRPAEIDLEMLSQLATRGTNYMAAY
jgi:hypothetical protein